MFINVDLPLPDGPMTARYSLPPDLDRDTTQRVNDLLAHFIELGDAFDLDDQRARRADHPGGNHGSAGRDHGINKFAGRLPPADPSPSG